MTDNKRMQILIRIGKNLVIKKQSSVLNIKARFYAREMAARKVAKQ
jgi:hypothetical protein